MCFTLLEIKVQVLICSVYQFSSRFKLIFQFTIAAIVLAFVLFANAHVVVDIAKPHSHVGSHGPALVNTHGSAGGYWGGDAHHGYSVGYPHGAPHITLHTTGNLGKC